jgi:hypothetical protein
MGPLTAAKLITLEEHARRPGCWTRLASSFVVAEKFEEGAVEFVEPPGDHVDDAAIGFAELASN